MGVNSPSNPHGLLARFVEQLYQLLRKHTDRSGKVDYLTAGKDFDFMLYELAVSELQSVDLHLMDPSCRCAFVINLYNAILPHAFIKVGVPSHDLARAAFFDGVKYNLHGEMYSMSDLLNGILRGNRTAPYHFRKPFSRDDIRKQVCLPLDHRIHFALNSCSKSCPSMRWVTPECIDNELGRAAKRWVGKDENVYVDVPKRRLQLSKICKWYAEDFGLDNRQVLVTLAQHAEEAKSEQMYSLLHGGPFTVKYNRFVWAANSGRAKEYSEVCLSCFASWA